MKYIANNFCFNFFPLNKSGSACHVTFSYFSEDCTQKKTSYHFQNKISTKSITF